MNYYYHFSDAINGVSEEMGTQVYSQKVVIIIIIVDIIKCSILLLVILMLSLTCAFILMSLLSYRPVKIALLNFGIFKKLRLSRTEGDLE